MIQAYSALKYLRALNVIASKPDLTSGFDIGPYLEIDHHTKRPTRLIIADLRLKVPLNGLAGSLTAREVGHFLPKGLYQVEAYSYHFEHSEGSFRMDSHDAGGKPQPHPHVNDPAGSTSKTRHLYYDEGFGLDTEDCNLFLMLSLCMHYGKHGRSPLDPANWPEYNRLLRGWRDSIR